MKTIYGAILVSLALLAFACGPKVNAPADVQAIKGMDASFDKPYNAGNAEALVSANYTNDALRMEPNQKALAGKDAIRASFQKYFDQYAAESRSVTKDVRVSGDLAVVRGTYEGKSNLKVGGFSSQDTGKWVCAYQRQPDGSWKIFWEIGNSDLAVADSLPIGEEEQALLSIERDWANALQKGDVAFLEKALGKDWVHNADGQVSPKKQLIADVKGKILKFESMALSDMKPIVLGETATVSGLSTEKSSHKGKDTSGKYRWTDIFVKRDGRWQCAISHSTKIS
jgi:ketosteroid isomerase-like protein